MAPLPKSLIHFASEKQALEYRNRQRKRNYQLGIPNPAPARRHLWQPWEDNIILNHSFADRELAAKLNVTVQSIQARRCRLKKNGR